MIASVKQDFDYDNHEDYRVVILHTHPRYDVRTPDNRFIKHLKYLDFIKECEDEEFKKYQYLVRKRVIFIPAPERYQSNYELIGYLMNSIDRAALAIAKSRPKALIKVLVHEHALCVGSKCLWKHIINICNRGQMWTRPYRIHIIKTDTIFLNGCQDIIGDVKFYKSSNPNTKIE